MASILTRYRPLVRFATFRYTQASRTESSDGTTKPKTSTKINQNSDKSPLSWQSLLVGGGFFAGITAYMVHARNEYKEKIARERSRAVGSADLHSDFELIDTKGNVRKSSEFRGKWLLVYFGFTHCPDICPEELDKISLVVDKLEKNYKSEVIPMFITVDPDRDTPELIDKYLKDFSSKFIGFTGSKDQIRQATRNYRIYYSAGPKDNDQDYIVDHSIISYLVDPTGQVVEYFSQAKTAEDMVSIIALNTKFKYNKL